MFDDDYYEEYEDGYAEEEDEDEDMDDEDEEQEDDERDDFRFPGEDSSLRCGEVKFPCPQCGKITLTEEDVRRGYRCNACADGWGE